MSLDAIKAGCCASFASLFGKLSGIQEVSTSLGVLLKVTFFVVMVVCNTGVWTCYAKALQRSKSSVPATVTSTATSYIGSAILGKVVFDETVSLYWWCGAILILIGLALVVSDQQLPAKED